MSLFSNCGAGDIGYAEAGFRFVTMAELDPRRLEVALLNHPEACGVPGDLVETWTTVVTRARSALKGEALALLAACPPCQGMSSARSGRGKETDPDRGSRDPRNLLVLPIAHVANALQPRVIVVENVPAFLRRTVRHPDTNNGVTAAALLVERLAVDYVLYPLLTDLADFGVPQTRKRTFLTFIRRDDPTLEALGRTLVPYPIPTHADDYEGEQQVTISEALEIYDLPRLDAGTSETAVSEGMPMHTVPVWNDRRYEMVEAIPPGSGLSAWTNNSCPHCAAEQVEPESALCSDCGTVLLRPVVRDASGAYRLVKGFRNSSYRRMRPDLPASTITTASGHLGSDRTVHPTENRLLSTMECALLQSIPPEFAWGMALERWGHTNVRAMIGEAVPPRFTRMHGDCLARLLRRRSPEGFLSNSDHRYVRAVEKLGLDAAVFAQSGSSKE